MMDMTFAALDADQINAEEVFERIYGRRPMTTVGAIIKYLFG